MGKRRGLECVRVERRRGTSLHQRFHLRVADLEARAVAVLVDGCANLEFKLSSV